MAKIIPTILVSTFDEFQKQLNKFESIFDMVQIDVMDGDFVPSESFEEIEQVNSLKTKIKFELHLMVQDPLREMEKWTGIRNVERVIFHIESKSDPKECIRYARTLGWQVGIALSPQTPLFTVEPYYKLIDELLILTVYPGRVGAPFVPEVKDKIKEFLKTPNHPVCAIDGGVRKNNIAELKKMGVEIFCIGGALTMAPDINIAYKELMA